MCTGEAQEVLVLQPAAGTPAVHPAGQFVFALPQRLRQLKLVGRKAVGGKTDIRPVQPDRHAAFHALKRNENPFALHAFRQKEVLHIAPDGVEPLRNLSGQQRFVSRPGILGVGILRHAVSFHLDMRRNGNVRPPAAIVFRLLKSGNHLSRVHSMEKFPLPVQTHPQRARPRLFFRFRHIPFMIRMRIQPVLAKISRILQSFFVKHHANAPYPFFCPRFFRAL